MKPLNWKDFRTPASLEPGELELMQKLLPLLEGMEFQPVFTDKGKFSTRTIIMVQESGEIDGKTLFALEGRTGAFRKTTGEEYHAYRATLKKNDVNSMTIDGKVVVKVGGILRPDHGTWQQAFKRLKTHGVDSLDPTDPENKCCSVGCRPPPDGPTSAICIDQDSAEAREAFIAQVPERYWLFDVKTPQEGRYATWVRVPAGFHAKNQAGLTGIHPETDIRSREGHSMVPGTYTTEAKHGKRNSTTGEIEGDKRPGYHVRYVADDWRAVPELPAEVLAKIPTVEAAVVATATAIVKERGSELDPDEATHIKGKRNDVVASASGALLRQGVHPDGVRAAMLKVYRRYMAHDNGTGDWMPESEVLATANSIIRKHMTRLAERRKNGEDVADPTVLFYEEDGDENHVFARRLRVFGVARIGMCRRRRRPFVLLDPKAPLFYRMENRVTEALSSIAGKMFILDLSGRATGVDETDAFRMEMIAATRPFPNWNVTELRYDDYREMKPRKRWYIGKEDFKALLYTAISRDYVDTFEEHLRFAGVLDRAALIRAAAQAKADAAGRSLARRDFDQECFHILTVAFPTTDPKEIRYRHEGMRMLFCAIAARSKALRSEAKYDYFTLLSGPPGAGKGEFYGNLLSIGERDADLDLKDDTHSGMAFVLRDFAFDPKMKMIDVEAMLRPRVITEVSESNFAEWPKAADDMIRRLTRPYDTSVQKYDPDPTDVVRRYILCGSINEQFVVPQAQGADRRWVVYRVQPIEDTTEKTSGEHVMDTVLAMNVDCLATGWALVESGLGQLYGSAWWQQEQHRRNTIEHKGEAPEWLDPLNEWMLRRMGGRLLVEDEEERMVTLGPVNDGDTFVVNVPSILAHGLFQNLVKVPPTNKVVEELARDVADRSWRYVKAARDSTGRHVHYLQRVGSIEREPGCDDE